MKPSSLVNEAGILASDSPAQVARKLDAAYAAAVADSDEAKDKISRAAFKCLDAIRSRAESPGTTKYHHPQFADGLRCAANMMAKALHDAESEQDT